MSKPVLTRTYDDLVVEVHADETALGQAACELAVHILKEAVEERGMANLILATGNSQLAFLEALRRVDRLDWSRIRLFHMDEYLGMSNEHPASFRRFMTEKLLEFVKPAAFYELAGDVDDPAAESQRYAGLLQEHKPDLCCLGIGENGHLAFNDPPYADFDDPKLVKTVELDLVSRKQQVGEGHFASLQEVPTHALTLTVPALLAARRVLAIVPETRKAQAVKEALTGQVTPNCPASILRQTPHARLFLDKNSASLLPQPLLQQQR